MSNTKDVYKVAGLFNYSSIDDVSFSEIEVNAGSNIEVAVSQYLLRNYVGEVNFVDEDGDYEGDTYFHFLSSNNIFSYPDIEFKVNDAGTMAWVQVEDEATFVFTKVN